MSQPEKLGIKSSMPIHPADIEESDFNFYEEYMQAYWNAERNYKIAQKLAEIDTLGGFAVYFAKIIENIGERQDHLKNAKTDYDSAFAELGVLAEIFDSGGFIKVKPPINGVIDVWHWQGSGHNESHGIVRELTDVEEFIGTTFSWEKSSRAAYLYGVRGDWIQLRFSSNGPNFEVIEVNLPQID